MHLGEEPLKARHDGTMQGAREDRPLRLLALDVLDLEHRGSDFGELRIRKSSCFRPFFRFSTDSSNIKPEHRVFILRKSCAFLELSSLFVCSLKCTFLLPFFVELKS